MTLSGHCQSLQSFCLRANAEVPLGHVNPTNTKGLATRLALFLIKFPALFATDCTEMLALPYIRAQI